LKELRELEAMALARLEEKGAHEAARKPRPEGESS
jgi:hypothetical protein